MFTAHPAAHTTTQRMLISVILRTGLEDSRNIIHFLNPVNYVKAKEHQKE